MPYSPLYVDPEVNIDFIVSDERSTDHCLMDEKAAFKSRLDEAARAAGFESRVAFATAIGAGDNAKQVAQQWVDRQKVPEKYRAPMQRAGVSIDYVNGDGDSVIAPRASASQSAGLDVGKLADLLGTVEAAIEEAGVRVPPRVRARLVATLYVDEEASAAASAEKVGAALLGILATMETLHEPTSAR